MDTAISVRRETRKNEKPVVGRFFVHEENRRGNGRATAIVEKAGPDRPQDTTGFPSAVQVLIGARTADAVFVVDPEHRVVHWDARMEVLTGLMSEETVGGPCCEAFADECNGVDSFCGKACSVIRMARLGEAPPSYEARIPTRWGHRRWVSVSILSVDSEEGAYLVHLVRDAQRAHETIEMARALIQHSSGRDRPAPDSEDAPALTARQLQILRLLSEGKSVKEIRAGLHLSEATVRNHIRSVLQALGAHSQLEALAKARGVGLLSG